MRTNLKFYFFLGLLLSTATSLRSEPLSHYRDLLKIDAKSRRADVKDRLQNFRANLGISTPKLELVHSTTKESLAYPTTLVRQKREFSSSLFKETTARAAKRLNDEENLGKPATFDPAKMIKNALAEQEAARDANIAEAIGDFDVFIDRVAKLTAIEQIRSASSVDKEQDFEIQVRDAIKRWIRTYDPSTLTGIEEKFPKIESSLGTLTRAEIYDGVVMRMIFSSDKLPDTYAALFSDYTPPPQLELSLSMLLTYRMDEDAFFVDVLRSILKSIDQRIDSLQFEKNADGSYVMTEKPTLYPIWKKFVPERKTRVLTKTESDRLEKLNSVRPFVATKFEGARAAHEYLKKLDVKQVNFLIDLFLQLQSSMMLGQNELGTLVEHAIEQYKLAFEFQDQVSKKWTSDQKVSPGDKTMLDQVQAKQRATDRDIASFKQLHEELSYFSDYLEREKKLIELQKDRLKDLEEGRSWK